MGWLSKMSLRAKILIAFAITSAGFVWIAWNGIVGASQINARIGDLYDNNLTPMKYILEANIQATSHFRNLYRFGLMQNADVRKSSLENVSKYEKKLAELIEAYRKTDMSPAEIEEMKKYDLAWPKYKKDFDATIKLYEEKKDKEANEMILTAVRPGFQQVEDSLNKIAEINDNLAQENHKISDGIYTKIRQNSFIFLAAMIAFAIVIGLFLAANLNQLIRSISSIAERLGTASETVASAATEISATSQSLSESTTEQASALEETASSLEEMSAMIAKNSESSKQSSEAANVGLTQAEKGRKIVNEMLSAMQEIETSNGQIQNQVTDSNHQLESIINMINEISSKTKVINDIVFQTKLLSFNASVEAARAGENGKGFAVVAEEVGNLAQMSGNAAKEISQLLEQSTGEVQKIVSDTQSKVGSLVEKAKVNVSKGATTAQECASVFSDIYGRVGDVTRMSGEISTASEEQSRGIQQINTAMGQLNQVTQQTAASSGQVATAASDLSSQSEALKTLVGDLVRTVTGKNDGSVEVNSKKVVSFKEHQQKKVAAPKPVATAAKKRTVGEENIPGRDDARFEDL